MTAPNPERLTPEEVREAFQVIADRISILTSQVEGLRQTLELMREGLQHAASAPASAPGDTVEFVADTIALGYDDKTGAPVYKALGGMYRAHGLRIWPEVLALLVEDADQLRPGANRIKPRTVIAQLPNKDSNPPKHGKVIGLAE